MQLKEIKTLKHGTKLLHKDGSVSSYYGGLEKLGNSPWTFYAGTDEDQNAEKFHLGEHTADEFICVLKPAEAKLIKRLSYKEYRIKKI